MLRTSLVVAALAAVTPPLASQTYNWIENPGNGHFYALTMPMDWTSAEAEAVRLGGHLTAIAGPGGSPAARAEQRWLTSTFGGNPASVPDAWLGAYGTGSSFAWTSGETGSTYGNCCLIGSSHACNMSNTSAFKMVFADPQCPVGSWRGAERAEVRHGIIELDFDPSNPASVTAFGSGCPGTTAATPILGAAAGSLPQLGATFVAQADSIPSSAFNIPFGLLGLSNTQVPGGAALPLDLGVLGAPGCALLVSADDSTTLANHGGTAAWQIPIPLIRDLAGATVFTQVMVLAPGANQLGLVVTNGLRLTLGY